MIKRRIPWSLFAFLIASLQLAAMAMAQDSDHRLAVALYDEIRESGPQRTKEALARAQVRAPLSAELLIELGSMLHWTSQGPAAVLVLERATEIAPGSARAWKDLGDARGMIADADGALVAYRRAADAAPVDPALDAESRDGLLRSARRHALLVERAEQYSRVAGAYRTPEGEVWVLRYDPYLALFPTLLAAGTGEYRVLRPTEDPLLLDYVTDDGNGTIRIVEGAAPLLEWTAPDGSVRTASRLPIEVRPVEVERPDVRLSGSMLVPTIGSPHPGVALLPGGGVLTRYHVMNEAWLFAAHGVAAIVWDRRGTGRSAGVDWTRVGFDTLVEDAAAMVERLRAEPGIDPERIGVWGHSQGGWHGPMLAARDRRIAFAILASGPATDVHQQFIDGMAAGMRSQGQPPGAVASARAYMERLFDQIRSGAGINELEPLVAEARGAKWGDMVMKPELAFEPVWWRENDFDPAATLQSLRMPVLALFGSRDNVVPIAENAFLMASHLAAAPDFTVQIVPDADHGMSLVDDRVSPIYLRAMIDWLAARGFAE
jgi:pimeloyl-ACP methyl ester carboxylesterase